MRQLYQNHKDQLTAYYDDDYDDCVYGKNYQKEWSSCLKAVTPFTEEEFNTCVFNLSEIEQFEKDFPELTHEPLTKVESQELGRMKQWLDGQPDAEDQSLSNQNIEDKEINEVNAFTIEAGRQIDRLYNLVVSEIKKGGSYRKAESLKLSDIKCCYTENQGMFPDITEAGINAANGRFGGSQQSRDVKWAILLNMVENRYPLITSQNTFSSHWQKMWPYYTDLVKKSKK